MSQSGKNEHQPMQSVTASMPVIALGAQIGCVTLIIVLLAAFGGIWLDNLLGTKPLITILLILGAAPLSLFLTYLMSMQAIRKVNQQQSKDAEISTLKEDETGE